VGTTSIESSERLSKLLKARKIPHQVLNAKHHEREAQIVAQAGHIGAVTVATNMAGRGTDIILGGNPEFLAKEELRKENVDPAQDRERYTSYLEKFREQCRKEREKVTDLGGLKIIGTERHEARRIDNQLRGRSGRQGDPGSSRFYLSLEDDLLRLFGSDRIQGLMEKLGMEEGESIEHPLLTKAIASAQKKVEEMHFDIRKQLLAYDNVMNRQREAVYAQRQQILGDGGMVDNAWEIIEGVIDDTIEKYFPEEGEADPARARSKLKAVFGPGLEPWTDGVDNIRDMLANASGLKEEIRKRFRDKVEALGEEEGGALLRFLILHTLDNGWKDHLLAMDELRRGIGLRAIGQKDPLLEYQFESYNLFQGMMERVRESIAELAFRVRVVSDQGDRLSERERRESREFVLPFARSGEEPAPRGEGTPQPVKKGPKVGRNDPCPCGSGKKYKHCCGANK